ncbi:MAG: glutamyl-tRNA reductase [Deltaproteobacteria bacterium]|nr:glutamyl-tRNA reductase [Deltaproteobacteria bacterium]
MNLWSLVLDFKKAPLELRAKAIRKEKNFAKQIANGADELVFLSTCNRVEFYAFSDATASQSLDRWKEICGLSDEEMKSFQILENEKVLDHLFRVAASMESMVVGETQIVGQVKKAYEEAAEEKTIGPIFHRCFQRAFKVAKRVRSQTEVGRLAISLPSIGVKLAEKVLGNLSEKTIGVIGLGEMGRLSAEYFGSVQPEKILLYNRTQAVAEKLAADLKIENVNAAAVTEISEILDTADVIVLAVDTLILKKKESELLESRRSPIFVLDLSVPPSVEKFSFQNVFFYSIDDLQKIAQENTQLREQEVKKAEAIIHSEVTQCYGSLHHASVSKTLEHLSQKAEQLTKAELSQLKARLKHLSAEDWAEIEKSALRLSHKVLQDPIAELRSQLDSSEESENIITFFRNLFRL